MIADEFAELRKALAELRQRVLEELRLAGPGLVLVYLLIAVSIILIVGFVTGGAWN